MRKKLANVIPEYSIIPLLAVLIVNVLAYFVTRLFTGGLTHFDMTTAVDRAIPFVPVFSVIYVLAYLQWIVGFILIAREERSFSFRVLSGEIISKLICAVLFLVIPTTMVRADITGNGFFSEIVRLLYRIDTPDNLFPSLHCLESWICFRAAMKMKKTGPAYTYCSLAFTLLVFASTVLIKQHVVVDIIAGVLVCELGQFIAEKAHTERIFARIDSAVRRKKDAEN